MKEQLSAANQKKLLAALKMMNEDFKKWQEKADEKRWSAVEVPLSLDDALARLPKHELSAIRINLGIKGASALNKKELTALLAHHIIEALPALLLKLDESRYSVLKQALELGGLNGTPVEAHQALYFTERGLLFPGKYEGYRTLVMPVEVMQALAACDHAFYEKTVMSNTERIKLALGMLYYYGTLTIDQLDKLSSAHMETAPGILDYLAFLKDADNYYKTNITSHSSGLSHGKVTNADKVKEEHIARKELPFFPFTREQLLLAGEPGFVDRNAAYQAFVDFIKGCYAIEREQADRLVEECVFALQNDQTPSQLLQYLQKYLKINSLDMTKAFMEHIMQLHKNTRQWALKGHTPNELSPSPVKTAEEAPAANGTVIRLASKKKIGRNDPCPCGSGKKFKKCCAN